MPGIRKSDQLDAAANLRPLEQLPAELRNTFAVGELALDRDGRTVRVISLSTEGDVEFAGVVYVNGDGPGAGGRIAGTEAEPVHEHLVNAGKVIAAGGDYYVDADWIVEAGLEKLDGAAGVLPCARCGELPALPAYDHCVECRRPNLASLEHRLTADDREPSLEVILPNGDRAQTFTEGELVAAARVLRREAAEHGAASTLLRRGIVATRDGVRDATLSARCSS